jgi:hypothetical protein
MRKPTQIFMASVLAGVTLVCLSASAAAQKQNDWPTSKQVVCFSPVEAA